MSLTNPYRQKNYMGEYANDGEVSGVLKFVRDNKWDSSGDGLGDPRIGMTYFDTTDSKMKVYSGASWSGLGVAQLSDLSDVSDSTIGAGRLLVSGAATWASQIVSGAITMASDGGTGFIADSEATADDADLLLIYDDSVSEYRRMTRANFLSGVGAAPGGSPGQIQWNSAGAFGGVDELYWDNEEKTLLIGGITSQLWASDNYALMAASSSHDLTIAVSVSSNDPLHISAYNFTRSRGTIASPTALQSGDAIGGFNWVGLKGTSWASDRVVGAAIRANAAETYSVSGGGTQLNFWTTTIGLLTPYIRYLIDGDGDHIWYGAGASPSQIMRIDAANDSLLIGNLTSQSFAQSSVGLQIAKLDSSAYFAVTSVSSDPTHRAGLYLMKAQGNYSSPTAVDEGDMLGSVNFGGVYGTGWAQRTSAAVIAVYASENWEVTGGQNGVRFEIQTVNTDDALSQPRYVIDGDSDHIWYGAGESTPTQLMRLDATYSSLILGDLTAQSLANDQMKMQIAKDSGSSYLAITTASATTAHRSALYLSKAKGSHALPTAIGAEDMLGAIQFGGVYASGWANRDTSAMVIAYATETWSATDRGTRLEFHTANNADSNYVKRYSIEGNSDHIWYGAGASPSQIMRIDAANGMLVVGEETASTVEWGGIESSANNFFGLITGVTASETSEHVPSLRLVRARGTTASPTVPTPGYPLGDVRFHSLVSNAWNATADAAYIKVEATDTWSALTYGAKMEFNTTNTGTAGCAVRYEIAGNSDHVWYGAGNTPDERLRLEAGGSLKFAQISAPGTTTDRLYNVGGTLTWNGTALGGGATPGGSSTEIQYRSGASTFGGAGAYWDATSGALVSGDHNALPWTDTAINLATIAESNYSIFSQIVVSDSAEPGHCPVVSFLRARGTAVESPAAVGDGNRIGNISFSGTTESSWSNLMTGAAILSNASGTWSGSNAAANFQILTTTDNTTALETRYEIAGDGDHIWYGAGATPTQIMRIDAANEVLLLGNVTVQPWTDPGSRLWIANDGNDEYSSLTVSTAGSGASRPLFILGRLNGTHASPSAVQSGWELASHHIVGQYDTTVGHVGTGFYHLFTTTELWSASGYGTEATWKIVATGETALKTRHKWNGDGTLVWYSDDETTANLTIPYGEIGIRIGSATADPTGVDGQVYYKSDTDKLRLRANGSWVDIATGISASPGGSTPQLQYNDGAGGFAAATNVRYDSSDGVLIIGAYDDPAWSSSVYGLHVMRDGYAGINVSGASTTAAEIPIIKLTRTHGADHDNPGVIESGDGLGRINFDGTRTAAWNGQSIGVAFQAIASEAWGVSATGTKFELQTTTNATITATTRYEIDGDGGHIWYGAGTSPSEQWRIVDGYSMYQRGIATVRENAFRGVEDVSYSFMVAGENATDFVPGLSLDVGDGSPALVFHSTHDTGSFASKVAVADEDLLGVISFLGWSGATNGYTPGAHIFVYVDGTPDTSNSPARIEFYTHDSNLDGATRYAIEGSGGHVWYGVGASPSQIFKLDAANVYAVAPSRAGEPSSAAEGAFFYDTTADVFKFGQGASPAWVTFGTGDVSKVGTPANDQLAVWTGDGTLEGSADISVDSSGHMSFGAANGAAMGVQNIAEEVTISVSSGSGGVATSGNLAPADSLILAVAVRVTDAPGGGATTFDVGITGSANPDELIDAVSTALNTQANSASNNDGTQLPIANGTATTLTVTTDADVTVDEMKVRIVVWYLELTEPTS